MTNEDRNRGGTVFAIEVQGLVKIYDRTLRALDGVNLSVKASDVFALLGPNGAGKTTLIRILTTQLRPAMGTASIFGMDVVKQDAEIRKVMSYVPQEMSVWTDISGYENLLIYSKIYGLPSSHRKKAVEEALESMGMNEAANLLVRTYSGGMIRRLEVACALLIKPKILFLDEPTIGLDPAARKAVWEKILSFKKEIGTTVFFNSHYMDEADLYSDEIAIIDRGKIVTSGTAAQLKDSIRRDVIHISAREQSIGEAVLNRIQALGFVNGVTVDNSELTVMVADAETALPGILETLRIEGVPVTKISATKPTLDDVFLKYAGTTFAPVGGVTDVRQVRRRIKRG
ncbi:MAG: ATP-binding cassette domain-containing protein [Candidatus Zixiibacteriota bacterium]